jgi:asparagine N-glycosylation enzyme membrane subunit Stt3
MIRILRYTEYLYAIVAVFSLYRIFTDWNPDRSMAYIFIFFAIISAGMFFFRRSYRKKFEQRQKDNDNQ